jgi:hypothetical protein
MLILKFCVMPNGLLRKIQISQNGVHDDFSLLGYDVVSLYI